MVRIMSENQYLIQGEDVRHVIRNLREARKELKRGFSMSCDVYIEYCIDVLLKRKDESSITQYRKRDE